jgi:predicted aldo/keto reductase-like oxidoreductase
MTDKYLGQSIGKLGFGYMRLPRSGSDFDYDAISAMVDAFLDAGFTYFDTAYVYPDSEQAMRKTLVERHPRETYQIATKLPMFLLREQADLRKTFDESCARLGTDFIDFYLLHGLDAHSGQIAEKFGAWDFAKKLRDEGRVRHYGFSFHDTADKLDEILTRHPDAEFVQLQINYLDWDSEDVQSRLVYETARKHGKPVVIMEPLKGGLLASDSSPICRVLKAAAPGKSLASWAVRFAASLDGVVTMLSGMNSMEQLKDNIATVKALTPLSDAETAVVREAVGILNRVPRIPCTSCKYCVENCPQQINIPELFDVYNTYLVHNSTANTDFPYMMATKDRGKPADCIACRACEEHCPQHIAIADHMSDMAKVFKS